MDNKSDEIKRAVKGASTLLPHGANRKIAEIWGGDSGRSYISRIRNGQETSRPVTISIAKYLYKNGQKSIQAAIKLGNLIGMDIQELES